MLVKKSPKESRPGCLDPHELEIMKSHWVAREETDGGKEKKAAMTPAENLQMMRDNMGFPNHNLCMEEIHTRFETIQVGGNEVGLWRYYTRKSQREARQALLCVPARRRLGGRNSYTVESPCRLLAELADAVVFNGLFPGA